jgi:ABC-type nitrate/sulfonate/bicarbonate transport system substrate-binding protein
MPGKITRISVTITEDTDDGPKHMLYGLPAMRKHARPERLEELLEDLAKICEDVQQARDAAEEFDRRPAESAEDHRGRLRCVK